jgi:hypothetical protein
MDKDQVAEMVRKGSTAAGVVQIQTLAKADMQKAHYGFTLHNACAATLSEFMISSLINVPVTLGVTDLARRIAARGWVRINVGDQQAGDVAVAESDVHIFLVLKAIDRDMMLIADNQRPYPGSSLFQVGDLARTSPAMR